MQVIHVIHYGLGGLKSESIEKRKKI